MPGGTDGQRRRRRKGRKGRGLAGGHFGGVAAVAAAGDGADAATAGGIDCDETGGGAATLGRRDGDGTGGRLWGRRWRGGEGGNVGDAHGLLLCSTEQEEKKNRRRRLKERTNDTNREGAWGELWCSLLVPCPVCSLGSSGCVLLLFFQQEEIVSTLDADHAILAAAVVVPVECGEHEGSGCSLVSCCAAITCRL